MLAKAPTDVEVYNDLNGELVNLFRVIKERPAEFEAAFRWCLASREEFNRLRDADLSTMDPVQRAYRFLYVNRCSFGGDMDGSGCVFGIAASQTSNIMPWVNNLERWLSDLHQRLRACYIENLPWADLLDRWDGSKAERGAVFFCDPPYLATKGYEVGTLSAEDHAKLAAALGKLRNRFMVTINDHPDIRRLYDGCTIVERTKQYGISKAGSGRKAYGELIISNYPLPVVKQAAFSFEYAGEANGR